MLRLSSLSNICDAYFPLRFSHDGDCRSPISTPSIDRFTRCHLKLLAPLVRMICEASAFQGSLMRSGLQMLSSERVQTWATTRMTLLVLFHSIGHTEFSSWRLNQNKVLSDIVLSYAEAESRGRLRTMDQGDWPQNLKVNIQSLVKVCSRICRSTPVMTCLHRIAQEQPALLQSPPT